MFLFGLWSVVGLGLLSRGCLLFIFPPRSKIDFSSLVMRMDIEPQVSIAFILSFQTSETAGSADFVPACLRRLKCHGAFTDTRMPTTKSPITPSLASSACPASCK